MLSRVLITEWQKLRTTTVWVPVLAAPVVTVVVGVAFRGMYEGGAPADLPWITVYGAVVHMYAALFLPLLAGALGALCCRPDHLAGGWKQLFTLPVTRTTVYVAKFACVLLMLALAQVLALLGVWFDGAVVLRLAAPIPWTLLARGAVDGWAAAVPIAALQLWAATWWSSFAAPLALDVLGVVPTLAVSASRTWAPLYPWALPVLAMLPGADGTPRIAPPQATTLWVAGGLFVVGGWLHFTQRDFQA